MFQQSVQNFGLKFVLSETKSIPKLNVQDFNIRIFLQVM